jgi:hypothetical protein
VSPAWIAVPVTVAVLGLALLLAARVRLDARRERWAVLWDGFEDDDDAPCPP